MTWAGLAWQCALADDPAHESFGLQPPRRVYASCEFRRKDARESIRHPPLFTPSQYVAWFNGLMLHAPCCTFRTGTGQAAHLAPKGHTAAGPHRAARQLRLGLAGSCCRIAWKFQVPVRDGRRVRSTGTRTATPPSRWRCLATCTGYIRALWRGIGNLNCQANSVYY